jgi:2,4-dienoyl-CoA reductase-like NADH-dependent reductase (Old Yellow Enzyme family)
MTIAEIKDAVKAFGQAAARAQMAGFDMVEIHACHGYLISNFSHRTRTNAPTTTEVHSRIASASS